MLTDHSSTMEVENKPNDTMMEVLCDASITNSTMNRTFHFSDEISHLLFCQWEIDSPPDLILAMMVFFLTALGLELLKVLNKKLGQWRNQTPLCRMQETQQQSLINNHHSTDHAPLLSSLRIPSSVSKIKARRFKFHIVESVIHSVQVGVGYILMLVAMTYNAFLFITIVFALTAGYFFLAPLRRMKKPRKVPVRHQSLTDSEHRSSHRGSLNSSAIVESAETSQNPYYGSLYQ